MNLKGKIAGRKARVAVIGVGYVGLPLAIEVARAGYATVGIDVDSTKVDGIRHNRSYIGDVSNEELASVTAGSRLTATTDFGVLRRADIINICVPTPFTVTKDPDVSFIVDAGKQVARYLQPGMLVILRSTTYPETTEKVLQPILDATGLKVGKDYYLSFVPERIDPGNQRFTTKTTPVVVGGVTRRCTDLTCQFYRQFVDKVVAVSSPRAAEMSKLLENIFRSVNIALVNEIALMCDRMGNLDIWEIIAAAATKPFGFMPFYPGPGIGGHCILIDPYYLAWKAREVDFHSNFIELAAQTTEGMPFYVAARLMEVLGTNGVPASRARLLLLGAAFKRNVEDTRHSPALKVMELLQDKVRSIRYHDPYVPEVRLGHRRYRSTRLTASALRQADCVVILTDHSSFDYDRILRESRLVFDTRNAIRRRGDPKLHSLGYTPVG